MRRDALAAAVAVAATSVAAVSLGTGASADPPDVTGWWAAHRANPPSLGVSPPTTPAPPTTVANPADVPPGGLYVAGSGEERATGISALRLALPDHAGVGDLVLTYHKVGGVDRAQGLVSVQACPAVIVWTPEEGGPITSAPPRDCTTGLAVGTVSGSTVRIPVGGLVRDGELNVVLLPQPGSAFEAVFAKPGPDAIAVTRHAPPAHGDDGEEACATCLPPTVPASVAPAAGPVADLLALPLPSPAASAFVPATRPASGPSRRIATDFDRSPPPEPFRLDGWKRAVVGGVLGALLLLYGVLLRVPQRRPATAAAAGRGIGRFTRPRTGAPPRL